MHRVSRVLGVISQTPIALLVAQLVLQAPPLIPMIMNAATAHLGTIASVGPNVYLALSVNSV